MGIVEFIQQLSLNYTLQIVALGASVLGIVSGALGSFAVLRKQSLLGDAMSHAALPGIVIAFIFTRSKAPLVLMLGAMAAGWIAALALSVIVRQTRIKYDSALGFVLSVFFGLGMMLLTFVQDLPDARQAGLETFLFGQAAAILERDVVAMAGLGGSALLVMVLLWKEFKLLSFDPEYAVSLGFPARVLDVILTTLLVAAIVVGLQAVGVVLMSAMIVAPAAAARQWTDRLGLMVLLAAIFGALAGLSGAVWSSLTPRLSTGPAIVLAISLLVFLSLLFAPNRGLVWSWVRRLQNRRRLQVEAVLSDLYVLSLQHADPEHPHSIAVLRAMNIGRGGVLGSLKALQDRGWARQTGDQDWSLTQEGRREAKSSLDRREDQEGGAL
jgi:manganese/zinc/iron transport system permease protein